MFAVRLSRRPIFIQADRHNQRARIVVGGITLARVGHGEDGVLQHAGVVGHGQQMAPYSETGKHRRSRPIHAARRV